MPRKAWSIPVIWPGETVVVLGGGPSLDLRQIHIVARARLAERCRVIAVNDAVFPAWWADWLHACDFKWWDWHKETALKFPGIRTTCTEMVPPDWAKYLQVTKPDPKTGRRTGMPKRPYMVAGGGNGGYQAIQCAVKAGGTKVVLLGFDMGFGGDGESHWFGDHPDGLRSDYEDSMLPNFPGLAKVVAKFGVEVVNCSPQTQLEVFPKARIEDVI